MSNDSAPTSTPEERVAQVTRASTGDVERLLSSVAALQQRIAGLEAQVQEVGAARSATAGRVEQLVTSVQRLDRIETGLSDLRTELANAQSETQRRFDAVLKTSRDDRQRDLQKLIRGHDGLEARVESVEGKVQRSELEERHQQLVREVGRLGQKLTLLEDRAGRLETAPPKTDPAVTARLDGFQGTLKGFQNTLDEWQRKIEAQTETVRRARTISDEMKGSVDEIRRDHHATAEAQRLAEDRTDQAVKDLREAADRRWETFLAERHNDWERIARDNAERDDTLVALKNGYEDLSGRLEGVRTALEDSVERTGESALERHRHVVEALTRLRSAVNEVLAVAERGLPESERTETVDEERTNRRRAFRAQRSNQTE